MRFSICYSYISFVILNYCIYFMLFLIFIYAYYPTKRIFCGYKK
ncbi:hypothetical protein CLOBOL_01854 [Enterocloster bolteae ATCC BAA-613]|uniref:Uncharacterized protein n=1 Tax=Enterocloster bolteae (strain ATCC BAA-613 / DSM 15670 / CCUG 46953 / JCM 12243 / WAL 16351) TaxID=411902 RepID=A8RMA0_ENTBW|nr:hypothetical protein CLOBOL_01854 [Enterocloster bolteae ATCC BAA-613]